MGVTTDTLAIGSYAAAAQTNSYVARLSLDARAYATVAITVVATVEAVKWTVFGATQSDYSDEVVVQVEATVSAATVGSFVVGPAVFPYYRAKIKNSVADTVGTAALFGVMKP